MLKVYYQCIMLNVAVSLVLPGCRYQNIKLTEFILLNSERVSYSSITFALLILKY